MRGRILALIRKEFIELRRSPELLRLVLIAPVIQLTMLGYAATTDVHNVPMVIADGDHSPRSRQLAERMAASRYFRVIDTDGPPGAVERALERGEAWLGLVIPAGFGRALERARPGDEPVRVQVVADGTDANSSGVALAYVQGVIATFNASLLSERGVDARGIDGRVRVWFNPELESRNFMVPGVLALLLLIITANLTSMAIVREREQGTLDQLNVTRLGRWELIIGKLVPYGLVGVIDVILVVSVAVFWFHVPLRGSVGLLFVSSVVYLLCTLGLGLFVSTISSTQQQAMMTATFFFLVPMLYLSGFIFPIENMPRVIQWVTVIIPLRYFLVVVRGIFLKGVGFDVLWPQLAAMGVWGTTVLTVAALRARKRG